MTPERLHLPGTRFLANPLKFESGTYKFRCPACLERSKGIAGVKLRRCKLLTLVLWWGLWEAHCVQTLSATDSTVARAKGELTCEPLSNQTPSHQLLKAELPIIKTKRDTTKRESKYPAAEERGPGVTEAMQQRWAPLPRGPTLVGKIEAYRERSSTLGSTF